MNEWSQVSFFQWSLAGGWVNICAWSDNEGVLGESCVSTQGDGCAYLVPPVGEGLVLVFPLSVHALPRASPKCYLAEFVIVDWFFSDLEQDGF